MASFLVNGRSADNLPVTDRSIHYGDGLFETIAVYRGSLLCWDAHRQRLENGCDRLNIPRPEASLLYSEAATLAADRQQAVVKIIISRGSGGRGYQSPDPCEPSRIMMLSPWPDYPDAIYHDGIECTISKVSLGHVPLLAGLKHLNRLEQVLARDDVTGRGYLEGLMRDRDGYIIEGTMTNLFFISGNRLITPSLEDCGVAGIVRRYVLEGARRWDLETEIMPISLSDLEQAEEVFVCNSILGIAPVTKITDKTWPVGTKTRSIRQSLIDESVISGP